MLDTRELDRILESSLTIFDAAPIGMVIADLDGYLIRVNDSFCETLGYPRDELIGVNFTEFTHPDDLKFNIKQNRKVVTGEIPSYQIEKRYVTKDEKVLHAIMKVTALLNENGDKPVFLLAQVVDITDRVDLYQSKVQSEKEFREIFEESAISIAYLSEDEIIRNVNKAMCDLLERPPAAFIGLKIPDILAPEEVESYDRKVKDLLVAKVSRNFTVEKHCLTGTGKVIHTLMKVSFLKGKGDGVSAILVQIVDISSLKNVEKLLHQKVSELEKVNQELDSFIYRASHDMQGPLATLKGLTNLMQMNNIGHDIKNGMKFSIEKLENTIRELVEYSQNSNSDVDSEQINMDQLITECVEVLSHHPNFSKISLEKNVDIGRNQLQGDLRRLKPIINNLLINSLTFHDLSKKVPFIRISCKRNGRRFSLQVADNGLGMKRKVANRALEMFYRGSQLSNGSGLGLYLIKEIVDKLDGTISLSSRPGKGTVVDIDLPMNQNET